MIVFTYTEPYPFLQFVFLVYWLPAVYYLHCWYDIVCYCYDLRYTLFKIHFCLVTLLHCAGDFLQFCNRLPAILRYDRLHCTVIYVPHLLLGRIACSDAIVPIALLPTPDSCRIVVPVVLLFVLHHWIGTTRAPFYLVTNWRYADCPLLLYTVVRIAIYLPSTRIAALLVCYHRLCCDYLRILSIVHYTRSSCLVDCRLHSLLFHCLCYLYCDSFVLIPLVCSSSVTIHSVIQIIDIPVLHIGWNCVWCHYSVIFVLLYWPILCYYSTLFWWLLFYLVDLPSDDYYIIYTILPLVLPDALLRLDLCLR